MDFLPSSPILQTIIATGFTWLMTALGAATVYIKKEINQRVLDLTLGFAAGVMIAASCWSLLSPALEMSAGKMLPAWLPPLIGFLGGGLFLRLVDFILPHLHPGFSSGEAEGIKTSWQRSTLFILAITLHNIPEGLAVGVAFGAAAYGLPAATIGGAAALTLGLGIHNFLEGAVVSVPLRREGLSQFTSFWYGQLSGIVEPLAGLLGVTLILIIEPLLPYALAFAAGAMIFVVVEEVIPESQRGRHTDLATLGTMLGFALMMILDAGLR